jgi:hypothetical protein
MGQDEDKNKKKPPMEGEGSYEGTRRYQKGVREFVKEGGVDPAAREAKKAVESDEADELDEAREAGKRGPPPQQAG